MFFRTRQKKGFTRGFLIWNLRNMVEIFLPLTPSLLCRLLLWAELFISVWVPTMTSPLNHVALSPNEGITSSWKIMQIMANQMNWEEESSTNYQIKLIMTNHISLGRLSSLWWKGENQYQVHFWSRSINVLQEIKKDLGFFI